MMSLLLRSVARVHLCEVPWHASKGDGVQVWVVMFITAEVEDTDRPGAGENILQLVAFRVQGLDCSALFH